MDPRYSLSKCKRDLIELKQQGQVKHLCLDGRRWRESRGEGRQDYQNILKINTFH